MTNPTLSLTEDLIRLASVTPDDKGCQGLMMRRLEAIGFTCTPLRFADVDNFWAVLGDEHDANGNKTPILCFAGHTDVVPTGPVENWQSEPFTPEIRDGMLYGRGTADMKASLAAMVVACEEAVAQDGKPKGRIAFLITSDEEGPAINGTVKVVDWLEQNNIKLDYCLVGEPSSTKQLGDIIKNGRRGSLGCNLVIKGVQGHIAYPHLAKNPIHLAAPVLEALTKQEWDKGNDFFPATSFQISNINSGTGATNVIPGHIDIMFNFRFSTEVTAEQLQAKVEEIINSFNVEYDIDWNLSGQPFLTAAGNLVDAAVKAIKTVSGIDTELSTSGGTSDGRFIAPTGAQVIELGPCNATIHQIDECVQVDHLEPLKDMYKLIIEELTY